MPRMNIIRPRCEAEAVGYMRFALACCLMGDGYIAQGVATAFGTRDSIITWYDEYSVDTLTGCADTTGAHKHWLGKPLESAQPYYSEFDSSVMTRRFEHGIAVMSWSNKIDTVQLGNQYMHIKRILYPTSLDSTIVTQVILPPRSGQIGRGIVLVKVSNIGIEQNFSEKQQYPRFYVYTC